MDEAMTRTLLTGVVDDDLLAIDVVDFEVAVVVIVDVAANCRRREKKIPLCCSSILHLLDVRGCNLERLADVRGRRF